MIERYSLPQMSAVWSEENRFSLMLEIELYACEALAKLGKVPQRALAQIRKKARFDVARIREIEAKTHHDVIAFVQNVSENIGEDAKYIHLGLTSSDCLDTALSVQMREACGILLEDTRRLLSVLRRQARRYKDTLMMGRTHSVHAEPVTFGLKVALWYDEMTRNLDRLEKAKETVSVGKISGAVGTYANIHPLVERYVCQKLRLRPARISTQIVQRDRHAYLLTTLAVVAGSLEKFATEIRNLQHTEIGELEEPFASTQKGSSAMPHKRNPIVCERICGLARLVRSHALVGLENMALWHERDISHSSAERVILPDATLALDYMLVKFTDVMAKIVVHVEKMEENLALTKGAIFSQRVMLELVQKGLTRDEAYGHVQRLSFSARDYHIDFKHLLLKDPAIRRLLSAKEIETIFDFSYHVKNVTMIFRRLGLS